MTRIYVPSAGPKEWRRFLRDPELHWKPRKSAMECAVAWEAAQSSTRGLPPLIAQALDSHQRTAGAELLIAIPELQVELPGGGHPSQNDVWALLRAEGGLCSMAVEAKAGEPLGSFVSEWLPAANDLTPSGKPKRLGFLRDCLQLQGVDLSDIRYQLLHRAASAILMGERFMAQTAILLVHSFGSVTDDKSRDDFRRFADAMGCVPSGDGLMAVTRATPLPLLLGWVADKPAPPAITEAAL